MHKIREPQGIINTNTQRERGRESSRGRDDSEMKEGRGKNSTLLSEIIKFSDEELRCREGELETQGEKDREEDGGAR